MYVHECSVHYITSHLIAVRCITLNVHRDEHRHRHIHSVTVEHISLQLDLHMVEASVSQGPFANSGIYMPCQACDGFHVPTAVANSLLKLLWTFELNAYFVVGVGLLQGWFRVWRCTKQHLFPEMFMAHVASIGVVSSTSSHLPQHGVTYTYLELCHLEVETGYYPLLRALHDLP